MLTRLETERLRGRPWKLEDAEAAFRMYGDPQVVRYIGTPLEASVETTRALLAKVIERQATLPSGMGGVALILKSSDELIGVALIKALPDGEGEPTEDIEIGWHLARRHWGQGYATEAGCGLLRHGFEELGLDELHAVVEEPNQASHAVARRLGMRDVGTTDAYYGRELRHYLMPRTSWDPPAAFRSPA